MPKVHRQYIPEISGKWLTNGPGLVSLSGSCIVCLDSLFVCPSEDVYSVLALIMASALAALLAGLAVGSETRKIFLLGITTTIQ